MINLKFRLKQLHAFVYEKINIKKKENDIACV